MRYDSLPGRAFPGDPDAYPGRDDVVAYLTDYARDFELPVELNSTVHAVRRGEDGYPTVRLAASASTLPGPDVRMALWQHACRVPG